MVSYGKNKNTNSFSLSIFQWMKIFFIIIFIRIIQICLCIIFDQYINNHIPTGVTSYNCLSNTQSTISTNVSNQICIYLNSFIQWDSVYYLTISRFGYNHEQSLVFFPLYPIMIQYFNILVVQLRSNQYIYSCLVSLVTLVVNNNNDNNDTDNSTDGSDGSLHQEHEQRYQEAVEFYVDDAVLSIISGILINILCAVCMIYLLITYYLLLYSRYYTHETYQSNISLNQVQVQIQIQMKEREREHIIYQNINYLVLFSCLNPITIFYITNYSESLYNTLVLLGLTSLQYADNTINANNDNDINNNGNNDSNNNINTEAVSTDTTNTTHTTILQKVIYILCITISIVSFTLASATRANGMFNCVLVCGIVIHQYICHVDDYIEHIGSSSSGASDNTSDSNNISSVSSVSNVSNVIPNKSQLWNGTWKDTCYILLITVSYIGLCICYCVSICIPYVIMNFKGIWLLCGVGADSTTGFGGSTGHTTSSSSSDSGSSSSSSVCRHILPNIYSHLQTKYWNVGLLQSYQWKQLPNFILATPVIVLCIYLCIQYYYINKNTITITTIPYKYTNNNNINNIYLYIKCLKKHYLLPHIIHMCVLLIVCVLFAHIQVTTRVLFSSCHVLYYMVICKHMMNVPCSGGDIDSGGSSSSSSSSCGGDIGSGSVEGGDVNDNDNSGDQAEHKAIGKTTTTTSTTTTSATDNTTVSTTSTEPCAQLIATGNVIDVTSTSATGSGTVLEPEHVDVIDANDTTDATTNTATTTTTTGVTETDLENIGIGIGTEIETVPEQTIEVVVMVEGEGEVCVDGVGVGVVSTSVVLPVPPVVLPLSVPIELPIPVQVPVSVHVPVPVVSPCPEEPEEPEDVVEENSVQPNILPTTPVVLVNIETGTNTNTNTNIDIDTRVYIQYHESFDTYIVLYCVLYGLGGMLLHTNAYPWT